MGGFCNVKLRLAVAFYKGGVQLGQEIAIKQNRGKWLLISGAQEWPCWIKCKPEGKIMMGREKHH